MPNTKNQKKYLETGWAKKISFHRLQSNQLLLVSLRQRAVAIACTRLSTELTKSAVQLAVGLRVSLPLSVPRPEEADARGARRLTTRRSVLLRLHVARRLRAE
jgi:hypothetical protein